MISLVKAELFIFAHALQFLTRLPITLTSTYSAERMAASVRYYPLVGGLIGLIAAGAFWVALLVFPPTLAVLISTGITLLATGGFHEDGLADTFDGIGGGVTSEQSLAIMKDSRIGVYGALALGLVLATKVVSLSAMPQASAVVAIIAAHVISRWSSVLAIATSDYVRDTGTGKPTADGISTRAFVIASVTPVLALCLLCFAISLTAALGAVIGLTGGHLLMRLYYEPKIRGYTGDCLGAIQQSSELGIYLGIFACL